MTESTQTRLAALRADREANSEAYSRAVNNLDPDAMRKARVRSTELDAQIEAAQNELDLEAEIARDLAQQRLPIEQVRRRDEALSAGRAALDRRNEAFKRLLELEIERRDFMRELVDFDRQALKLIGSTLTGYTKEGFENGWGGIDGPWMSRLIAEAAEKCEGYPASKRGEALKPFVDRFAHQADCALRSLPAKPASVQLVSKSA